MLILTLTYLSGSDEEDENNPFGGEKETWSQKNWEDLLLKVLVAIEFHQ